MGLNTFHRIDIVVGDRDDPSKGQRSIGKVSKYLRYGAGDSVASMVSATGAILRDQGDPRSITS